jgi:hypothetical protein
MSIGDHPQTFHPFQRKVNRELDIFNIGINKKKKTMLHGLSKTQPHFVSDIYMIRIRMQFTSDTSFDESEYSNSSTDEFGQEQTLNTSLILLIYLGYG